MNKNKPSAFFLEEEWKKLQLLCKFPNREEIALFQNNYYAKVLSRTVFLFYFIFYYRPHTMVFKKKKRSGILFSEVISKLKNLGIPVFCETFIASKTALDHHYLNMCVPIF